MKALRGPASAALVAAALVMTSATGLAQTRLYVLFSGAAFEACVPTDCEPGHLLEIDVERGAIVRDTLIRSARYDPSALGVTADGRYLVWSGAESIFGYGELSLFDAATRSQSVAASLGPRNGFPFQVFVHPTQFKAYLAHPPVIGVAAPGVLAPIALPGCDSTWQLAVSGDASRLFTRCAVITPNSTQVIGTAVLDGATGAMLAMASETAVPQSTAFDGSELYSARMALAGPTYRRWDVVSNSLLVERVVGLSDDFPMTLATDPRTGRLWASVLSRTLDAAIQVLDAATLQPLARFTLGRYAYPNLTERGPLQLVFDRDQALAYAAWSERIPGSVPTHFRTFVGVIDTETLTWLLSAELPSVSVVAGVAIAPRPPVPSELAGIVTGRDVTLRWSEAPGAPGVTSVDAGSGPGLTNLASLAVAPGEAVLVVPNVPPGTYFVRVRTRTAAGVEAISNEITVVVH